MKEFAYRETGNFLIRQAEFLNPHNSNIMTAKELVVHQGRK